MAEHDGQVNPSSLSKEERLRRFVGPTLEHDEEDIEFWRNASDELRGRTLYKLLARGKLIRASVGGFYEDDTPRPVLRPRRYSKPA